jgi:hypothetical protein
MACTGTNQRQQKFGQLRNNCISDTYAVRSLPSSGQSARSFGMLVILPTKLHDATYQKNVIFINYSKTCLKRNAIVPVFFFPVFTGFRFTKGCVLKNKKYERLGLQ